MLKLLVVAVVLWSSQTSARLNFDFQSKCQLLEDESKPLPSCQVNHQVTSVINMQEHFSISADHPGFVRDLVYINELENLYQKYDQRADKWGDFLRYLRGLDGDNVDPDLIPGFEDVIAQFERNLFELEEAYLVLAQSKARLQTCREMKCSIERTLELEDQTKILKNYYDALFISHPLLVSEKLIDHLAGEEVLSIRELLLDNLVNSFRRDYEIKKHISTLKAKYMRQSVSSQVFDLGEIFKYGNIIDLLLLNGFSNWNQKTDIEKSVLCKGYERREKQYNSGENIKTGLELGFLGISFFPFFAPAKAASPLVSFYSGLGFLGRVSLSGSLYSDMKIQDQECSIRRSLFEEQINKESFEGWRECLNQVDYLKFATALSILPVDILAKMPTAVSKFAKARGNLSNRLYVADSQADLNRLVTHNFSAFGSNSRSSLSVATNDGTYTLLNLKNVSGAQQRAAEKLSGDYWEFVGQVYKDKLKVLNPSQVDDFVQTSRQFASRTNLIVKSRGPPTKDNIVGGVATVQTRSADDLLPLEKATGFRIPHDGSKSIEVVRLTSTEAGKGNMQQLLNQMARTHMQDPDLKNVYVYTSSLHYRLYRGLGIKGEVVHKPTPKEVIIRLSREDLEKLTI